ncbi:MAG: APC family permease [Chloroflexota bacterium]
MWSFILPYQRDTALRHMLSWAAHLFYWVYPGVMVAFMGILLTYIAGVFGIALTTPAQIVICIVFAALVGAIAWRGISGSTNVAIAINVIQLVALVIFSILCILFRLNNPLGIASNEWFHSVPSSIVLPHNFAGLLFQSTIAILILVGFESSTALAAEAKNPTKDIPRGVILSLVIQGIFAYLFEYFAANYALSSKLTFTATDGTVLTGISAAGASGAPIGDLAVQVGNAMLGGNGQALMIILAITVAIAILGTTLAAMNTGVRISFAMAQDREMPDIMGLLHGKYATPHMGIVIMVIVSAIIGAIGVVNVVALTGITLASNLGTFVLYGMICAITIVAFVGTNAFNFMTHAIIPILGLIGNIIMVGAIFIIGLTTGGTTTQATVLALAISGLWLVVAVVYFVINSRQTGMPIIPSARAMGGTD